MLIVKLNLWLAVSECFVLLEEYCLFYNPYFGSSFEVNVKTQRHITSLQRLSCLYFELSKDQEKGCNLLPAAVV